jgi:hypothetical protein
VTTRVWVGPVLVIAEGQVRSLRPLVAGRAVGPVVRSEVALEVTLVPLSPVVGPAPVARGSSLATRVRLGRVTTPW